MSAILPTKYIMDTSMFTQAKRTYYAFDLAPSFWNFLIDLSGNNIIDSLDKVYDEIRKGKDDLHQWVSTSLPVRFFKDTKNNDAVLLRYQEIIRWSVENPQFNTNAKNEFAKYEEADAWVVASALTNNLTVVSQEEYKHDIKRKIPIPNVCHAFGIRHINTFTFLRENGFSM